MTLRTTALATFLLTTTAAVHPVYAADAEAMTREGIALRRAGHDDRALPKFEGAYAAAPSPKTAAQLGLCEHALGLWVVAEKHLKEALTADSDRWVAKNREVLQSSLDSVITHLATVEVRGEPDGAEVRIDGELIGTLPLAKPVRVVAGQFKLEATAPGRLPAIRFVIVKPGQYSRETVVLGKETEAQTPAVAPKVESLPTASLNESESTAASEPQAPRPWIRPAAWTAAGLGVVALGVAVTTHVKAVMRTHDFDNHVPMPGAECNAALPGAGGGDCQYYLDEHDRFLRIAIPAYVTAGVLAGVSAALFYVARDRHSDAGAAVAFCDSGPGIVGASCTFRF